MCTPYTTRLFNIRSIPCREQQWRDDRLSPIVEITRREGHIILAQ